MKWYDKFKVGQKVRVVKKIQEWDYDDMGASWNDGGMDKTMSKVYKIIRFDIQAYFGISGILRRALKLLKLKDSSYYFRL